MVCVVLSMKIFFKFCLESCYTSNNNRCMSLFNMLVKQWISCLLIHQSSSIAVYDLFKDSVTSLHSLQVLFCVCLRIGFMLVYIHFLNFFFLLQSKVSYPGLDQRFSNFCSPPHDHMRCPHPESYV